MQDVEEQKNPNMPNGGNESNTPESNTTQNEPEVIESPDEVQEPVEEQVQETAPQPEPIKDIVEEAEPLPDGVMRKGNKFVWVCPECGKKSEVKYQTVQLAEKGVKFHLLSAHGVGRKQKSGSVEEPEIEETDPTKKFVEDLKSGLYAINVPSQQHRAIITMVLRGDYTNPEHTRAVLTQMGVSADKIELLLRIAYPTYGTKPSRNVEKLTGEGGELENLVKILMERKSKNELTKLLRELMQEEEERKPRTLDDGTVVWMTDKEFLDFKLQMERIKARQTDTAKTQERKIRILDDGSQVPMTDEEYAQYKIAMAMKKNSSNETSGTDPMKWIETLSKFETEKTQLLMKMLSKEIGERLDDIERRVSVSDFDRFKSFKQKARELGFVTSSEKSGDVELRLKELDGKMQLVTQTLQNVGRKTEIGMQMLTPVVQALSRKILLDSGSKPPELVRYTDDAISNLDSGIRERSRRLAQNNEGETNER